MRVTRIKKKRCRFLSLLSILNFCQSEKIIHTVLNLSSISRKIIKLQSWSSNFTFSRIEKLPHSQFNRWILVAPEFLRVIWSSKLIFVTYNISRCAQACINANFIAHFATSIHLACVNSPCGSGIIELFIIYYSRNVLNIANNSLITSLSNITVGIDK